MFTGGGKPAFNDGGDDFGRKLRAGTGEGRQPKPVATSPSKVPIRCQP